MNHFSRVIVGVLFAGISVAGRAGVLSQVTTFQVPDPYLSNQYFAYFGYSGVRISDNGLVFVVAAPGVVNDPSLNAGVGAGFEFEFFNNQWSNFPFLANDSVIQDPGAYFGTGLALSADGGEAFFGFDGPCDATVVGCPSTPATNFVNGYLFPSINVTGTPIHGDGLASVFHDSSLVSFNGSWTAYGSTAALSGNGQTLIVGAPLSAATVPPPCNQCVPANMFSGLVTVYTYVQSSTGGSWNQTFITDPGAAGGGGQYDYFGASLALSADGTTAVIGAFRNSVPGSNVAGQPVAYVYKLENGTWVNTYVFQNVAVPVPGGFLSANGSAASSAPTPAVDANGSRVIIANSGTNSGASIFTQQGNPGIWSAQTLLGNQQVSSVAMSADGTAVALGTMLGPVSLYSLAGASWDLTQTFFDPGAASGVYDCFAASGVALSADKQTLIVPAGCATVQNAANSGLVYVYQSPADLSITGIVSPAAVALSQQTTFGFTVTNHDSQVTAYNVVLTDTLPGGFTDLLTTPGVGASCGVSGQTVTCTLPSLAPGASWSPSIAASVTIAGNYANTASVSSNQPDPDTTNNSVSLDVSMVPPTVTNGGLTVNADSMGAGGLTGGNPCNCGTLNYSIVQQPLHGTAKVTDAATGAFSYTPNAGYVGSDSFTFQLGNGFSTSSTATESITVRDVPPTAHPANLETSVNHPLSGALVASPGYAEQSLTYTVTQPAHGSVSVTPATGAFTYTPQAGFIGNDSFSFTAGDGIVSSAPAVIFITVNDIAPVANGASVSTVANQEVSGTLTATPGYPGQVISFVAITPPSHGKISVTPGGAFTYTPNLGFAGSDSFTFAAGDGSVSSAAATVTVTVQDVPPTAANGSASTTVNQPATGTLSATPGYVGQLLSYAVVTQPAHGKVVLNGSSGAFTYTPNSGYAGSDSFTFAAGDGVVTSATATINITVTDIAPTANNGSVSTNAGQAVSGTLSATTGYSGQALQFAVVAQPGHGTATVNAASGAFTYTPASGYSGSDSFTFTVGDGTLVSAAATESITVKAPGGAGGGGGGGFGLIGLGLLAGVFGLGRRRR